MWDTGWDWLPWNWDDGISKLVMMAYIQSPILFGLLACIYRMRRAI